MCVVLDNFGNWELVLAGYVCDITNDSSNSTSSITNNDIDSNVSHISIMVLVVVVLLIMTSTVTTTLMYFVGLPLCSIYIIVSMFISMFSVCLSVCFSQCLYVCLFLSAYVCMCVQLEPPVHPISFDDDLTPYSIIPTVYPTSANEKLLSDWPDHLCQFVYRFSTVFLV